MKIFIARVDNILKSVDEKSLLPIHNSHYKNIESNIALFLTKYIANKIYKIKNTNIERINGKPKFIDAKLNFSISHSKGTIAIAFSENQIGVDIELIKERNLSDISAFFKLQFRNLTEFYQYWTIFESEYKVQANNPNTLSGKIWNYVFSVSSFENNKKLEIYEINSPIDNTIPIELINLKLVNDNNINDIKLEINEINTAGFELLPSLAINRA